MSLSKIVRVKRGEKAFGGNLPEDVLEGWDARVGNA